MPTENSDVAKVLRASRRLLVAGALGAAFALGAYAAQFNGEVAQDQAVWGDFGEFVGGVLNPFLSLLALVVLAQTLRLQGWQIIEAGEEARKQRFEATAAQWFNLWLDALTSIQVGEASGVEAVRVLVDKELVAGLRRAKLASPAAADADLLSTAVTEFMAGPGDRVKHYLATLGVLGRFIQRGPELLTKDYLELLTARLSSSERQLILACWNGGERSWGTNSLITALLGDRPVESLGTGLPRLAR